MERAEEQPSLGSLLEALAVTSRLLWVLVAVQISVTVCGPGYTRNRQLPSVKLSTFPQKLINLAEIP